MSFATKVYKSLTVLETKVMVDALTVSLYDYCTDAKTIAENTGLDINTVKGVIGSLCKKGIIDAVKDKRCGQVFLDIFPTSLSGEMVSFGNENLGSEGVNSINEWIKANKNHDVRSKN